MKKLIYIFFIVVGVGLSVFSLASISPKIYWGRFSSGADEKLAYIIPETYRYFLAFGTSLITLGYLIKKNL